MRILSWNVNGLRSVAEKGFLSWLESSDADILGVQETRARPDQLPSKLASLPGWHVTLTSAQRPGYSGVGLFSRHAPDELLVGVGHPELDTEGRLQLARFGRLWIANGYFPNGSGKDGDNSRVPLKLEFYRLVYERLEDLRRAKLPVLVIGDLNTAHREIDLARPKENSKTSGFLPEERAELDRWLCNGWIDTFRRFHPQAQQYSWWTARFKARERNLGWRLDYVLVNDAALPFVRDAFIWQAVMGSDHCPVGVDLDDAILE